MRLPRPRSGVLALAIGLLVVASPLRGQEVQGIAAVVNDEVITLYDLKQRMQMVIAMSNLENTPEVFRRLIPQVLRGLVDERLKMQKTARFNVEVTEEEMARRIALIERLNNIPEGGFDAALAARGVSKETARSQVRAELAWGKLIRRQFRGDEVSDDEVDEMLARIKSAQGQPEYLISEIFLAVDGSDRDEEVRDVARRLVAEIRRGADFAQLARQFSQSASAYEGGVVGWVLGEQLAAEVLTVVERMKPGEVSDPVRVLGGFRIIRLRDRRTVLAPNPDEVTVALEQILFPLPSDAAEAEVVAKRAQAEELRLFISDCDAMARAASELGSETSGHLGHLRLKDLLPSLRETVRVLPIGVVSAPIRTDAGLHLLMVCERTAPPSTLPDREEVRRGLHNQRLELLARRYLRDLRRAAFVDIRL
ncbi:MAG: peptidylprolyl isomerase [Alphaproteobacteria bacterium]